ncbi:hypothetical protein B0H13DRAFT_2344058 [Mycena leptocephala]|nr:hypothetical protein B0H13DRAFT_2373696 [Mycena leptocephala]KAJ7883622.1 hypothetical protein B0H13DRAFT_2344058 [Mycena leptocephala]
MSILTWQPCTDNPAPQPKLTLFHSTGLNQSAPFVGRLHTGTLAQCRPLHPAYSWRTISEVPLLPYHFGHMVHLTPHIIKAPASRKPGIQLHEYRNPSQQLRVALNKFFVPVVLAVMCAATVALAAPWPAPASLKHVTNHLRVVGRGLQLNTFHPASAYETFGQAHLGVAADGVAFRSSFASEISDHAFLRQLIDGIPVANVVNIALNKDDKVVAIGCACAHGMHQMQQRARK